MKSSFVWATFGIALLGWSAVVLAGRAQTLSMEPDPGCQRSKLVVPVEQVLKKALRAPGLKVLDKGAERGRLLLQYFLMEHAQGDSVQVQLDGQVYGRSSGKLLAEGNARSDGFAAEDSGRQQAAEQAAERLAEQINEQLEVAFAATGKGRRIMLQLELSPTAMQLRERLVKTLNSSLKSFGPTMRGSTERNLVFTLYSSERSKALAERIDRAIAELDGLKSKWIVKSASTLMMRVER